MGMDVYGKAPASPDGEYFRASVWSWRPIHELIEKANVLPPDMVEDMSYNDGAGPDKKQAKLLAYALEMMIDGMSDDHEFMLTDELDGAIAEVLRQLSAGGVEVVSPRGTVYSADVAHVREFIKFCRDSGGFEVW